MCPTIAIAVFSTLPTAGPTPVAWRFAQQVEVRGESRLHLERARNRLLSPPLDNLDFVLADVNLQMTRRFTNYSGDISGRMLGALNVTAPLIGGRTSILEALMAGFRRYQKPDGHFGADQNLAKEVNQERDMPILWGNGRLLLALAERCRTNPDPDLLAMARRLGDYLVSTRPYYGKRENYERVGGSAASGYTTCYPSLVDGLAAIGEITGDRRFLDEARFISELSLLDKEFKAHHSHGRLTAYRGMLDLDRVTGKREFLDAVLSGVRTIIENHLVPTGGVMEYFERTYNLDEGCSEADWVRVNMFLWQATGRTEYLDVADHALHNHLMAMQFRNGGFGHRMFRTLQNGADSYPLGALSNVGSESYWCCAMHGTQLLADAARWAVLASDDKILITWLAEARSTFKIGAASFTVTVAQDSPGSWTVSVETSAPTETTLRLRVPGWAGAIAIDGQFHRPQDGWISLTRKWPASTTLKIVMPTEIHLAGVYAQAVTPNQPTRVFSGGVLYCLPELSLADGLLNKDAVPNITMAAKQPAGEKIPVVIEGQAGRKQAADLVPVLRRPPGGARWLFNVRRVDEDAFRKLATAAEPTPKPGAFVELEFGGDAQCQFYLNGKLVAGGVNQAEAPQIELFSTTSSNTLAVKARSDSQRPGLIGVIRVGDRVLATRPDGWSAVPCLENLPPDWLVDPAKGSDRAVKLLDLCPFGADPWKHTLADFAGTDARWIWPDAPPDKAKGTWLLRYSFEVK